jgi:hypothetical protein
MPSAKCQPGCQCGRHTRSGNRSLNRPRPVGKKPCPPGCGCGLHARVAMPAEERRKRDLESTRRQRTADSGAAAREAARRWSAKHPDYRLSYLYGLSPEGFAQMFAAQEGLCYLCGEVLSAATNKIQVDHDHSCCRGQRSCGTCVRGLTCKHCNLGIGHFGDDPDRMRRVADNLEMANRRVRSSERQPVPVRSSSNHAGVRYRRKARRIADVSRTRARALVQSGRVDHDREVQVQHAGL